MLSKAPFIIFGIITPLAVYLLEQVWGYELVIPCRDAVVTFISQNNLQRLILYFVSFLIILTFLYYGVPILIDSLKSGVRFLHSTIFKRSGSKTTKNPNKNKNKMQRMFWSEASTRAGDHSSYSPEFSTRKKQFFNDDDSEIYRQERYYLRSMDTGDE